MTPFPNCATMGRYPTERKLQVYAMFTLWNVVGKNALGAVSFRLDIAAPDKTSALWVARKMAEQTASVISPTSFEAKPRKRNGETVRVAVGYLDAEDYGKVHRSQSPDDNTLHSVRHDLWHEVRKLRPLEP